MSSDQAWSDWIEVQKRALRSLNESDTAAATAAVESYLERVEFDDLRSDALAFRASIHEQQGDSRKALEDLRAAHELARDSYQRYSLELSLGRLFEDLDRSQEALQWYFRALETATDHGSTAAGTALLRVLKIRGEKDLSPDERRLAEKSAKESWHLLRMKGEPDLQHLEKTALLLIEAQSRPLPD